MKTYIQYLIFIVFTSFIFGGCKKIDDWLDVKRLKDQVSPETLKDFQAILDNFSTMGNRYSSFGLVGADDIYLTDEGYAASSGVNRNAYTWNKTIWESDNISFWDQPYQVIFKSNVVLEGLNRLTVGSEHEQTKNDVMGQALFHRSISYYNLAQLFCKPYTDETADIELGLPLKLTSDANVIETRSSLYETYGQIIEDAQEAVRLLPINSLNNRRPNKAAGYALLAKVYLTLDDYEQARDYADMALQLHSSLLDFNSDYVSENITYRFPREPFDHPEILFYTQGTTSVTVMPTTSSLGIVTPLLYGQYEEFDLRKNIFFALQNDLPKYRGSYTGRNASFCGIATNEIYLIRAECHARLNEIPTAIADLNTLLQHRYKTGEFNDYPIMDQDEVLELILSERRKELIGVNNIRWEDIRRLNKEERFKVTLTRVVNGETFTLEPNGNRYALPIPDNEIQLSGIEQNPR